MKLNVKLLVVSLIAGFVGAVLDAVLYHWLVNTMSLRILIPLLFAVFAGILCAAVSVYMACFGKGEEAFLMLEGRTMLTVGLICAVVVLFFSAMLLEWLYDSDFQGTQPSTSYIFVLDESGSMTINDPSYSRYSAVEDVMEHRSDNLPYAVYMFAEDCVQIRPMGNQTQGPVKRPENADYAIGNNTGIQNALETVLEELQSGRLEAGSAPHVILMTDGYASDMSTFSGGSVLRKLSREGARISTVGLGSVDDGLMQRIADKTGGTFVMVEDAADLAQGFENVTLANSQNDLLSTRTGVRSNVLYFFLRLLFLLILGAVMGCLKAMACGEDFLLILIVTLAGALVGTLLMELCQLLGMPEWMGQILFWILLSVTPNRVPLPVYRASHGSMQIQSPYVTHSGGSASSNRGRIEW